ncbi:unnamed protein product, partial [Ilex paraguariensis]
MPLISQVNQTKPTVRLASVLPANVSTAVNDQSSSSGLGYHVPIESVIDRNTQRVLMNPPPSLIPQSIPLEILESSMDRNLNKSQIPASDKDTQIPIVISNSQNPSVKSEQYTEFSANNILPSIGRLILQQDLYGFPYARLKSLICDQREESRVVLQFLLAAPFPICLDYLLDFFCELLSLDDQHGLSDSLILVESDSQILVHMVKGLAAIPWQLQDLLKRIKLLFGMMNLQISHIYREANGLADFLASFAVHSKTYTEFSGSNVLPVAGRLILQQDQTGLPSKKVVKQILYQNLQVPISVGVLSHPVSSVHIGCPQLEFVRSFSCWRMNESWQTVGVLDGNFFPVQKLGIFAVPNADLEEDVYQKKKT